MFEPSDDHIRTWSRSYWAASWLFWPLVLCWRSRRHNHGCYHWSPSSSAPHRSYQTGDRQRDIQKEKKNRFPVLGKSCVTHFPPSHTAAPVHPQTDPSVISLQRSRCLSLVVVHSSRAVDRHTDVGRFPETQHKKKKCKSEKKFEKVCFYVFVYICNSILDVFVENNWTFSCSWSFSSHPRSFFTPP